MSEKRLMAVDVYARKIAKSYIAGELSLGGMCSTLNNLASEPEKVDGDTETSLDKRYATRDDLDRLRKDMEIFKDFTCKKLDGLSYTVSGLERDSIRVFEYLRLPWWKRLRGFKWFLGVK